MEDNILPVLPIKDLINGDGEPNIPFKIATGTKYSISHLHVLFCPCVVQKSITHVGTKALNMCHKAQMVFCVIFIGITQHQKGVPSLRTPQTKYRIFLRYCF